MKNYLITYNTLEKIKDKVLKYKKVQHEKKIKAHTFKEARLKMRKELGYMIFNIVISEVK